jgi:hypothetical protein
VILGAGHDSFAWRRPDLLHTITVFEVDDPATQQRKRARAVELALPGHDQHVCAPIDFETQSLIDALNAVGFDWHAPTLFSWLGVIMYLTLDAIKATLQCVTRCTPASEIVLTYAQTEPFRDETGNHFVEVFSQLAAEGGEPIQTLLAPTDAELLVQQCQLAVTDHPSRATLHHLYFTGRRDGLQLATVERIITAVVPNTARRGTCRWTANVSHRHTWLPCGGNRHSLLPCREAPPEARRRGHTRRADRVQTRRSALRQLRATRAERAPHNPRPRTLVGPAPDRRLEAVRGVA